MHSFFDIEGLLKTKKEDGQVMKQVMRHVVSWVNPQASEVLYRSESNKPLCREDLKPALRRGPRSSEMSGEDEEDQVEAESKTLERLVLDSVVRDLDFFKSPATQAALGVFPSGGEEDSYAERFVEEPWEEILHYVQEVLGPRFRPAWRASPRTGVTGERRRPCSITRSLGALALKIPEIACNPALSSQKASEELCQAIDEAVGKWAARRSAAALEDAGQTWGGAALKAIQEAQGRYGKYLVADDRVDDVTVSGAAVAVGEGKARGQDMREERGSPSAPQSGLSPATTRPLPRELIGQGRAELGRAADGETRHKGRVAGVVEETVPMGPPLERPIWTDRGRRNGDVKAPTKQTQQRRQKNLQFRKAAREGLPSIGDMLAGLSGGNGHSNGNAGQTTRRWEGLPVAR